MGIEIMALTISCSIAAVTHPLIELSNVSKYFNTYGLNHVDMLKWALELIVARKRRRQYQAELSYLTYKTERPDFPYLGAYTSNRATSSRHN